MAREYHNNEMPKVVDPIYFGPVSSGRTKVVHCEYCGQDVEMDVNHTVYTHKIRNPKDRRSVIQLTFSKHSHKHKFIREHPELEGVLYDEDIEEEEE